MIAKLDFVVSADQDASSFDDCIHLDHEVTFFVPSTSGVNRKDTELYISLVEYLEAELSEAYGGVTRLSEADGCWMSEAVGLVREKVTPVRVYVAELTPTVKAHIVHLAYLIKSTMRQESVLLVLDGKGRLY